MSTLGGVRGGDREESPYSIPVVPKTRLRCSPSPTPTPSRTAGDHTRAGAIDGPAIVGTPR
jgi:hypothetical protein